MTFNTSRPIRKTRAGACAGERQPAATRPPARGRRGSHGGRRQAATSSRRALERPPRARRRIAAERRLQPSQPLARRRRFGARSGTVAGAAISFQKWQATPCPASNTSGGDVSRQSGRTCGQRVWKWQPDGGASGLGTSPPTSTPLARAAPARAAGSRPAAPCVYGWRGAANSARFDADLDDAAEVHHRDAVGDVADDREVVGDEQVRRGRSAAAGPAAG